MRHVNGTCTKFFADKGYGWCLPDGERSYIFTHVKHVDGHRALIEGDRVEFDIEVGDRGPFATNVQFIGEVL